MKMLRFISAGWNANLLLVSVFPWRAAVLAKTFGVAMGVGGYFLLSTSTFPQGSLTPPGAPTPTMKTLDQVEPRIPIDTAHAPGDATSEFTIQQPGSYYLTGNLSVTKTNGISVMAVGVTVDLNGFQVARISGSGGTGISATGTIPSNCTIKNGSIQVFTFGIAGNGVSGNAARGGRISFINVSTCSFGIDVVSDGWGVDHCNAHDNINGIIVGNGCIVSQCTATNNTGSGIGTGDGSTIVDCSAYGNRSSYGISAGIGCTVVNCTANGNTSASSASYGIFTAGGCTIIGCTAQGNTNTNATPGSLTGVGIYASAGTTVKNCSTIANKGDGLHLEDKCIVSGCTSNQNAFGINGGNAVAVSDSIVAENKSGGLSSANGCTIRSVTAYKNHGTAAINVADGSTVTGCTVRENDLDGIKVTTGTIVSNNESDFNGTMSAPGVGIHVTGFSVRVEGNNATGNFGWGIKVDGNSGVANTIFHNSVHPNASASGAYSIASGNDVGPIGSAATSTSPFANISY